MSVLAELLAIVGGVSGAVTFVNLVLERPRLRVGIDEVYRGSHKNRELVFTV